MASCVLQRSSRASRERGRPRNILVPLTPKRMGPSRRLLSGPALMIFDSDER